MSDRSKPTLADYLVSTISPVLIMALVGSLAFFLLNILYRGEFVERMRWTLFFFVFGSVLISRIAMLAEISGRAGLYGIALGFVVWLALQAFVEYPPGTAAFSAVINIGLILLVWWCAHRLTWDCTSLDDAAGRGALDAAGLKSGPHDAAAETTQQDEADAKEKGSGFIAWWERYCRYRDERRRRPHTPGTWVVYFSLAALPLFGLGQALIPSGDVDRHRHAFWLMIIYVGSGLGLLLSTGFLGLRRYLRQRQLQMPKAMTAVWLSIGGLLIAGLLLAGAILPRPRPEYRFGLSGLGSRDREASRDAVLRDDAGSGDEDSTAGRSREGNKEGSESGNNGDQAGGNQKGRAPGCDGGTGKGQGKAKGEKQDGAGGSSQGDGSEGKEQAAQSSPSSQPASSFLESAAKILKWIVFALVILAVVLFLLWALLRFLGNFTGWAGGLLRALQSWWQGLFGWLQKSESGKGETEKVESLPEPRPFVAFSNPFLNGRARRLSPAELVRYSFEALQAWGNERHVGRRLEETPFEFAVRLGEEFPALEAEANQLADLYARVAYATGPLPSGCLGFLQHFWQQLQTQSDRRVAV